MASGSIPRDSSIPKVLTVSPAQSRPASIASASITAYQIGYLVYVYYTIEATGTFSTYATISTIADARTRGGASQPQNANILFADTGTLKPRMSTFEGTNTALFQCIVSKAGIYAGSFVYVTDVAP